MLPRLRRWLRGPDVVMSQDWLKSQDRLMARVEHHGPSIQWPIKKVYNESPEWNARRLRRAK